MSKKLANCWYCEKQVKEYTYEHFKDEGTLFNGAAKIVCPKCKLKKG